MTMERLELILEEPDKMFFSGDDIRGQVMVYLSASIAVQVYRSTVSPGLRMAPLVGHMINPRAPAHRPNSSPNPPPSPHLALNLFSLPTRNTSSTKSTSMDTNTAVSGRSCGPETTRSRSNSHCLLSCRRRSTGGSATCDTTQRRCCYAGRRRTSAGSTSASPTLLTSTLRPELSGCEEQKSTNSCFFCCPRGTIVASAELKRRGFAPGEIAPLFVDIHNMSNSSITTLKAVILQMVEYSSPQGLRRHEDERRVLEVNRGEVKPGASFSWGSAGVRLPPLPPTSFAPDSCKIISIQYRMDVMMYIAGMRDPLTLRLPIIVGNIPLKRHFPGLSSHAEVAGLLEASFPRSILSRYPHIPGTMSQESVNPEQSECVYKLPNFKPKYLVYVPKSLIK